MLLLQTALTFYNKSLILRAFYWYIKNVGNGIIQWIIKERDVRAQTDVRLFFYALL